MKNIINKLLRILFHKKSSLDALRRILTKSQFRSLLFATPDRRECFEAAAKISGVAIEELLRRSSSYLDISVLFSIKCENHSVIKRFQSPDMFYKAAVFPLVRNNILVGIVCVDPTFVSSFFPEFSQLPKFLSSWSVIKAALDEVEWEENIRLDPQENDRINKEVVLEVIFSIFEEVSRYGEYKVVITLEPEPFFTIPLKDGRKAKGSINKVVKHRMHEILSTETRLLLTTATILIQHDVESGEFLLTSSLAPSIISVPEEKAVSVLKPKNNSAVKPHVLLIDDNETFSKVLDKFLSKLNVSISHASNGRKALEMLDLINCIPDLIICDIHMPIMNGFEFVKRIKEQEKLCLIPVIMLTSDSDVEAEISLLSSGVDAYIGKQQDPRILCMHVKRIIEFIKMKDAA